MSRVYHVEFYGMSPLLVRSMLGFSPFFFYCHFVCVSVGIGVPAGFEYSVGVLFPGHAGT